MDFFGAFIVELANKCLGICKYVSVRLASFAKVIKQLY